MQNTINNGNLVHLPLPNFAPLGMLKKLKSINHKVHNHEYSGYTKVTKTIVQGFGFVHFVPFFTHLSRRLAEKVVPPVTLTRDILLKGD